MAYFSNGSEGADYAEQYCERCVHYQGCSIWGLHLLYNYDQCNDERLRAILTSLIPVDANGWAKECSMFVDGEVK